MALIACLTNISERKESRSWNKRICGACTAQEAAAAAKREATAAAEALAQEQARGAALAGAKAAEERKCAVLQADLTELADQADVQVRTWFAWPRTRIWRGDGQPWS